MNSPFYMRTQSTRSQNTIIGQFLKRNINRKFSWRLVEWQEKILQKWKNQYLKQDIAVIEPKTLELHNRVNVPNIWNWMLSWVQSFLHVPRIVVIGLHCT